MQRRNEYFLRILAVVLFNLCVFTMVSLAIRARENPQRAWLPLPGYVQGEQA